MGDGWIVSTRRLDNAAGRPRKPHTPATRDRTFRPRPRRPHRRRPPVAVPVQFLVARPVDVVLRALAAALARTGVDAIGIDSQLSPPASRRLPGRAILLVLAEPGREGVRSRPARRLATIAIFDERRGTRIVVSPAKGADTISRPDRSARPVRVWPDTAPVAALVTALAAPRQRPATAGGGSRDEERRFRRVRLR
jgi:hypothetical protein